MMLVGMMTMLLCVARTMKWYGDRWMEKKNEKSTCTSNGLERRFGTDYGGCKICLSWRRLLVGVADEMLMVGIMTRRCLDVKGCTCTIRFGASVV